MWIVTKYVNLASCIDWLPVDNQTFLLLLHYLFKDYIKVNENFFEENYVSISSHLCSNTKIKCDLFLLMIGVNALWYDKRINSIPVTSSVIIHNTNGWSIPSNVRSLSRFFGLCIFMEMINGNVSDKHV